MKHGVLVISPDAALSQQLLRSLTALGYDAGRAQKWTDVDVQIDALAPDVVLLDAALATASHQSRLIELVSQRPTVVIAHTGSVDDVLPSMRAGADCHLLAPINAEALELKIRQMIDAHRMEAGVAIDGAADPVNWIPELVGDSDVMSALGARIAAVARGDEPVVITGEPGVGKSVVAREIHRGGCRAGARFVPVACRSIDAATLEARLFGRQLDGDHGDDIGGGFGLVDAAAGGTLFLAGVDAIGPAVQAALLRLLETGRYRRVGERASSRRADVRIIAASSRELPRLVRDREFSAELHYRLSAAAVEVPALRTHRADIPALVDYFARRFAGRQAPPVFDPQAIQRLLDHAWPGNVRELCGVVKQAMLLGAAGGVVQPEYLPLPGVVPHDGTPPSIIDDEPTLDVIARRYMAMLLERYAGNRRRVAEVLGVSERTAYRMLDRFDLKNS